MRFTSGRLAGTRAARHVLLAAGSAALAAGMVAGSASLATASATGPATGSGHGHGHGAGSGSGQPSTAPAFFAGIISQSTSASPPSHGTKRHRHKFRHHASTPAFVDVVQTFSSANGALAGTVTFPSGQDVESLARLGADQSFVAASFDRSACVSHLWKFTIDSAGKPGSLSPFSVPQVSGALEALASSADGSTVAFTAEPCKGGDQQIEVVRQATGTVHRHGAGGGVTRWNSSTPTGSLSLTADGSVLGFVVFQSDDQGNSLSKAWTLSTTARGGPLLHRAHQVPGPAGNTDQAVLSPSGDQIWTEAENGQGPATLILATTSTGAQVRQVTQLSDGGGRLALDNSGQHMLSYGGNPGAGHADVDQIDLSSGQTRTLTITDPVIDGSLTTFAW